MKKNALLIVVAVFAGFAMAGSVHADDQDYNDGLKQELNQDVEQMYPKRPKADAQAAAAPDVQVQAVRIQQVQPAPAQATIPVVAQTQVAPQAAVIAQQPQPVYILAQPQAAPQAQVQPVTTVEDTPVKEPKIETLRKQREEVERQTEDKMMQKLEDARLESEKERAERIANIPLTEATPAPNPAVVAPQAAVVQEAVIAQPQQAPAVVAVAQPVQDQPDVVSASKLDEESYHHDHDDGNQSKFTVGALGGIGSYPTSNNISGAYAAGATLGLELPSRIGLELDGVFSNYNISNPSPFYGFGQSLAVNLNQIDIDGGLNYFILPGRVTPVVGVLAGYTRRNYSNLLSLGYPSGSFVGSSALEGGLKAGVDVHATEKLIVSLNFEYMMNISYRMDNPIATYFSPMPFVEGLSYYVATLGLKLEL